MIDLLVDTPATLAFGLPGHGEWLVLLILGLLIFGKRLPDVGRSVGRSIVEFKRGIKGIEDEIEEESNRAPERIEQRAAEPLPNQSRETEPAIAQPVSDEHSS